jgi:ABC-2 type transport system permease protein
MIAPAALLAVTLLSWRQYSLVAETNRKAREQAARSWEGQPPRFPLQSLAVPWIAPVEMSPLVVFEPGNGQWQGTAFYLQPGYLARAQDQLGYDYFGAGRQAELNAAALLRVLIPLFALLVAWRHRSAESFAWTSQLREILERLAPSFAVSFLGAALLSAGELGGGGGVRMLLLLGVYLLYAIAAQLITSVGFRWIPSQTAAGAAMAFFWLFNLGMARPVSLNLAALGQPLPRLEEFLRLLDQETRNGYLGSEPRADRERRFVAEALRDYKVKTVRELPVNLSAILLQREERHQREVYNRRVTELRERFAEQDRLEQGVAFLMPHIAIEIASASLAATDVASEHYQLAAADAYWDKLAERVYADVVRTSGPEGLMKSVGADYWKQFPRFQSKLPPPPFALRQSALPMLALLTWILLMGGLLARGRGRSA